MSDSDGENCCPLCMEEIDLADKNFLPCPCGYKVRDRRLGGYLFVDMQLIIACNVTHLS